MFAASKFNPPWFDPTMPDRSQCVVAPLLEHWAATTPERVFAIFDDGEAWTWKRTRDEVRAAAQGLQQLGVAKGDAVAVWLPNSKTMFVAWFAINYLGAVYCPINTSFRGNLLAHVIRNAGARVMVCHPRLMERLHDIDRAQLEAIVVADEFDGTAPAGLTVHSAAALKGNADALGAMPDMQPWDTYGIIYTSGTTGPSKGVLASYLQLHASALVSYGYVGPEDRMLVNLPLFHVGGTNSIFAMLARGGSFVLVDGFDSKKFWDQIKGHGCTTTAGLIGAMTDFLAKAPPSASEKDNPLRIVTLGPVTPQTVELAERYGFDYVTGFNMTEVSVPLLADVNTRAFGSCGKPRDGMHCKLVDENDIEVATGQLGELICRSDMPWTITTGYNSMPEATARAWRNGWFHTGDMFRKDEHGNFFFMDRTKDAIRRRGENISSLEVEREVMAHRQVLEVAAIPVPNTGGEDEVMVVVAPKPGEAIDPAELLRFLIPRMAHFMVPRYVRMVNALAKTETNKIQKAGLRNEGVTADTWDREVAGIVVKREKLG